MKSRGVGDKAQRQAGGTQAGEGIDRAGSRGLADMKHAGLVDEYRPRAGRKVESG